MTPLPSDSTSVSIKQRDRAQILELYWRGDLTKDQATQKLDALDYPKPIDSSCPGGLTGCECCARAEVLRDRNERQARTIDAMRQLLEAAEQFTGRTAAGMPWRSEVTNEEYHALCSATLHARHVYVND